MSLKSFKPVTPSNRYKVWPSFDEITTSTPEKSLCRPLKKSGGRNNNGRITTRRWPQAQVSPGGLQAQQV